MKVGVVQKFGLLGWGISTFRVLGSRLLKRSGFRIELSMYSVKAVMRLVLDKL